MTIPTSAYSPDLTHLVAWPYARKITFSANNRRVWVPFLNVSRELLIQTDQSSGMTVEFGPGMAASVQAVEVPFSDTQPFASQVQTTGVWVVNRSGTAAAVVWIYAVLGPDQSVNWPAYTAANGFESVDEAGGSVSEVALS